MCFGSCSHKTALLLQCFVYLDTEDNIECLKSEYRELSMAPRAIPECATAHEFENADDNWKALAIALMRGLPPLKEGTLLATLTMFPYAYCS